MVTKIIIDDKTWSDVTTLAVTAARPVARGYRRWVEYEDVKQTALEYAVNRQDKIVEYLYEQDEEGNYQRRADKGEARAGETALITFLRRRCERYARREKAAALGYEIADEYFYRPAMVENLIKVWGSGEYDLAGQVLDPAEMGGKRKKTLASEGNDLLAMMADVDSAMKRLDQRTRSILVRRLVEGETLEAIAHDEEVTAQRVDQLVDQGLRKVVDLLGGPNPY